MQVKNLTMAEPSNQKLARKTIPNKLKRFRLCRRKSHNDTLFKSMIKFRKQWTIFIR